MSVLLNDDLRIFNHYNALNPFVLYEIEGRFFVSYLCDYGFAGGERVTEISRENFIHLSNSPYDLQKVLRDYLNSKIYFIGSVIEKFSYTLEPEPYILYKMDNRYFITLWTGQRTDQQTATEISLEDFKKLQNKLILPIDLDSIKEIK